MPVLKRMLTGMASIVLGCVVGMALLFGITVAAIAFGFPVVIAGILLVVLAIVIVLIVQIVRHDSNRTVVRFGWDQPMYEHECKDCTGGAQWLGPEGWGPIPESIRLVRPGSRVFHPPLANTRSCGTCRGRRTLLLPYPPKERASGLGD